MSKYNSIISHRFPIGYTVDPSSRFPLERAMSQDFPISEFMTPCPYQIDGSVSLAEAERQMKIQNIRHTPVISEGQVLGVLCERDLKVSSVLCESTGVCPLVGGIDLDPPYVVSPETPTSEVAGMMAREKHSCAIVADEEGIVVGIFTTTDACRVIELVLGE